MRACKPPTQDTYSAVPMLMNGVGEKTPLQPAIKAAESSLLLFMVSTQHKYNKSRNCLVWRQVEGDERETNVRGCTRSSSVVVALKCKRVACYQAGGSWEALQRGYKCPCLVQYTANAEQCNTQMASIHERPEGSVQALLSAAIGCYKRIIAHVQVC